MMFLAERFGDVRVVDKDVCRYVLINFVYMSTDDDCYATDFVVLQTPDKRCSVNPTPALCAHILTQWLGTMLQKLE
jgi:hypothetical protein